MAYRFQKQLELATDQTLVEPNWEGILECVDMIRGGEVPVKEAIKTLQKRYHHTNPHISHHALLLLEACVKNCGRKFVAEVATKEFMEDLKNLVVSNPPELVRTKVLELIQCWTSAFQGIPEYKIVGDTHSLLKMNGFEFPPIDEAKAMFLAESAPDWAEGDNCYRCRVEFGVFTRKHHCRACGQIFCDRCSSKQMLLPQFGIEKKVRVCEACFDAKQAQQPIGKSQTSASLDGKSADETAQREKELKEAQAKEQEELELALAISQSEAEAKEQERLRNLYQGYNGLNSSTNTQPIGYTGILPSKADPPPPSSFMGAREDMSLAGMGDEGPEQPFDSILAKYLDRDYWERKRRETEEQQQQTVAARATAPPPSELSMSISSGAASQQQQQRHQQQNGNGFLGKNIGGTTPMASAAATAVEDAFENETLNQLDFAQLEEEQQPVMMGMGGMTTAFGAGKQQKQQQMQANNELERSFANLKLARGESAGAIDDGGGGGGALEGEERVAETAQFCRLLRERVDTLNNRMRSNQLRGRSIVNDSAIHSLFSQLSELHGAVLQRMTKIEEQREHYERLQDHLAHFQEARQAVNALREENERERMEKLREEQNRRQALLRQKLEVMRHKKHEKLMNDRYAYIQRFQEQERQIRPQRGQGGGVQQQQQSMSPLTVGGGVGAGTSLGMGGMAMAGGGMPMPMMPQQHMGIGSPMELIKSSSSNQMPPPEVPTSYAAIDSSPTPIHQQLQMPMPSMQPQMPMPQMQQPQFHQQMPMPPHYHQQQYSNQMPMPMMPYSPALSMPQQQQQFQPVQHHQQQQHFPLPQHQQQQQNQATNGMGTHHPQQQQESQAKGGNGTTAAANEVPEDLLISFD